MEEPRIAISPRKLATYHFLMLQLSQYSSNKLTSIVRAKNFGLLRYVHVYVLYCIELLSVNVVTYLYILCACSIPSLIKEGGVWRYHARVIMQGPTYLLQGPLP